MSSFGQDHWRAMKPRLALTLLLLLILCACQPNPGAASDSDLNGDYVRRYIDREACVVVYFMYEGAATSLPVYQTTLDVEGCEP